MPKSSNRQTHSNTNPTNSSATNATGTNVQRTNTMQNISRYASHAEFSLNIAAVLIILVSLLNLLLKMHGKKANEPIDDDTLEWANRMSWGFMLLLFTTALSTTISSLKTDAPKVLNAVNTASAFVLSKVPFFSASRGHHQQQLSTSSGEQGPTGVPDNTVKLTK